MQQLRFINSIGEEVNFTDGVNFGITEWNGLSECSLNIQSQQVPFKDGSVYLDSLLSERELSFTVALNDNKNLNKRYELKREIISKLNPRLGQGYLYYKNDFLEKRIQVIPQMPVFPTKNYDNAGTLKFSISFIANDPYWEDLQEEQFILNSGINNVECKSDVGVLPIVKFFKTNCEQLKIESFTNGKKIELQGNINGTVTISTESGNKKILLSEEGSEKIIYSMASAIGIVEDIMKNDVYFNCKYTVLKMNDKQEFTYYPFILNLGRDEFIKNIYADNGKLFVIISGRDEILIIEDKVRTTKVKNGVLSVIKKDNYYIVLSYSNNQYIFEKTTDFINYETLGSISTSGTQENDVIKKINFTNKYQCVLANGLYVTEDFINFQQIQNIQYDSYNGYIKSDGQNYVILGRSYNYYISSDLTTWEEKQLEWYYNITSIEMNSDGVLFLFGENTILWTSDFENYNTIDIPDNVISLTGISIYSNIYKKILFYTEYAQTLFIDKNKIEIIEISYKQGVHSTIYSFNGNPHPIEYFYYNPKNKTYFGEYTYYSEGTDSVIFSTKDFKTITLSGLYPHYGRTVKYKDGWLLLPSEISYPIYYTEDGVTFEEINIYDTVGYNFYNLLVKNNNEILIVTDNHIYKSTDFISWIDIQLSTSFDYNNFYTCMNKLYYTDDDGTYIVDENTGNITLLSENVYYYVAEKSNIVYLSNNEKIYKTKDFLNFEDCTDLNVSVMSEKLDSNGNIDGWVVEAFYDGDDSSSFFYTADFMQYLEIKKSSNNLVNIYITSKNDILSIYHFLTISTIDGQEGKNIINMITNDSNMNFILEKGINRIMLTSDNEKINGLISFRNKYIGV